MASSDYGFNSVEDLLAWLRRYGVSVGEEVMEGMSQISPGPLMSNLQGAAQIMRAPLTPWLTEYSERAAEYVTPLLNRQAAQERENLFDFGEVLREGGFDVPEQKDFTEEQVAPWVLAALSLGRKPPKKFRKADKDVDYPISKEGLFSPTQKTITEQAGKQPVTWAGQTANQWLKAFQRGGANQEIKATGLLTAMQQVVPNENIAISPEQMSELVSEHNLLDNVRITVKDQDPSGGFFSIARRAIPHNEMIYSNDDQINFATADADLKNQEEILVQLELPDSVRERILEWQEPEGGGGEELLKEFDETGKLDPNYLSIDILPDIFYQNATDENSAHWPNFPNVLLHLRTDEMKIGDRERLFLQEVQSDWDSRGHAENWRGNLNLQPHDKAIMGLNLESFNPDEYALIGQKTEGYSKLDKWAVAVNDWLAMRNVASHIGRLRKEGISIDYENLDLSKSPESRLAATYAGEFLDLNFLKYDDSGKKVSMTAEEVQDLPDELLEAVVQINAQVLDILQMHETGATSLQQGTIDMPFKGKYAELGARVLVSRAIEKGLTGIAWTTGEIQADRYHTLLEEAKGYSDVYDKQLVKALTKLGKRWGVKPKLITVSKPAQFRLEWWSATGDRDGDTTKPGNVKFFDTQEEVDDYIIKLEDYRREEVWFNTTPNPSGKADEKVWTMDFSPEMIEHLKKFGINVAMEDKKKQLRFDEPLLGTQPMGLLA